MKKKSPPPIPPLSLKALNVMQEIEQYAKSALRGCSNEVGNLVNPGKALRILRTCVVEALNAQLEYYSSLPSYRQEWVRELEQNTIASALGLMPMFTSGEQFRGGLQRTLRDHVRQRGRGARIQGPAIPQYEEKPINKQLDAFRRECRLTVEDLAEAIEVAPRSVYRHLSGEAVPRPRQIAAYESLFSNRLGKPIRLETSVKRQ